MTLNHSKTWPVSTLAVVQLRVDPNGRTYSTQFDAELLVTDFDIPQDIQQDTQEAKAGDELQNDETQTDGSGGGGERVANGTSNGYTTMLSEEAATAATAATVETVISKAVEEKSAAKNGVLTLPLSQRHVALFTIQEQAARAAAATAAAATPPPHPIRRHPYKTTVRTDTVSTILDQDNDHTDNEHNDVNSNDEDLETQILTHKETHANNKQNYERFHVLALAKIEEISEADKAKTPTVRVENWDLIYNDPTASNSGAPSGRKLCPACTAAAAAAAAAVGGANGQATSPMETYKGRLSSPGDYNDRLLVDLPLDARKATTLRRHYYPEGGWGWVIITCTVLVHVLNVGVQLSCSQLAPSGAEKFKTTQVQIADRLRGLPQHRKIE